MSPTLFWMHLTHCTAQFNEFFKDLNEYMTWKKDNLLHTLYYLKERDKQWQCPLVGNGKEPSSINLTKITPCS